MLTGTKGFLGVCFFVYESGLQRSLNGSSCGPGGIISQLSQMSSRSHGEEVSHNVQSISVKSREVMKVQRERRFVVILTFLAALQKKERKKEPGTSHLQIARCAATPFLRRHHKICMGK